MCGRQNTPDDSGDDFIQAIATGKCSSMGNLSKKEGKTWGFMKQRSH